MSLPDSVVNYYDKKVLKAYKAPLIGTFIIPKGDDLPPGTGSVTRQEMKDFKGKAKRGYRVETVPRETGERDQKTVTVVEHVYGFRMHRKALQAYQREGNSALAGPDANEAGRLVALSLDDIIFNGWTNAGVKGIFQDAGQTAYAVTSGYEWNKQTTRNPEDNFIDALEQFEADGIYTARRLVLSNSAYRLAFKKDHDGSRFIDGIAAQLPGGMDSIFKTPVIGRANGLICDYDVEIAERNVEEDINVLDFGLQPDSNYYFNAETYQATDIHKLDAFMQMTNLVDLTP